MPRTGGRRKKTRTHRPIDEKQSVDVPRSIVIRKGQVVRTVRQLVRDVRQMMMPLTAKNLRERSDNKLQDFVSIAGPLGVTHLFLISQRGTAAKFKLARLPGGPTLTFDIVKYSLMSDVRLSQTAPRTNASDFAKSPLVVLNGFKQKDTTGGFDARAIDIMRTTFVSLFPSIDVREAKVESSSKRIVLFQHATPGVVEVRQYAILQKLTGVSGAVSALYSQSQSLTSNKSTTQSLSDLVAQIKQVKEEAPDSDEETPVQDLPARNVVQIRTDMLSRPRIREKKPKDDKDDQDDKKIKKLKQVKEENPAAHDCSLTLE